MKAILCLLSILLLLSCNNKKNKIELCHENARYLYKYESFKNHEVLNGIKAYFDYEWAIDCAREKNKPILIYFTGHAIICDRSYESALFNNDTVIKLLTTEFIPVFLYVDDKTRLPRWDYIITENDTLTLVGQKYARWQIEKFESNAQPYFAIIDHDQNLMNEPVGYITGKHPERFIQFLEEGLENYKSGKQNGKT